MQKQARAHFDEQSAPIRHRQKVKRLAEIEAALAPWRRQGKKVALCHGVFDLLHVGHLRHLAAAKSFADLLVVTITADEFVNKGPDRPAFQEELRAEMLAGLDLVDFVCIVHEPSAISAIEAVRPDFMVKGQEYSDHAKDITGKIALEQEAVRKVGGELVYTDDITFSSSNLLNRFISFKDEAVRQFLADMREAGMTARVDALLRKMESLKVLIVGETIIDRYIYVDALGKAAKENIIATLYRDEEDFAGGAVAAANHAASLCPNISLLTLIGDSQNSENFKGFIEAQIKSDIRPIFVERPGGPTIQKIRYVDPTHVRKLFEVYRMDDQPLPRATQEAFHEALESQIRDCDLVIVCDFGHGFMSEATIRLLEAKAPLLAINTQSNAGNIGYNLVSKYSRADLMCIDMMEARLAAQDKHAHPEELIKDGLVGLIECPKIIVTHGKSGCFTSESGNISHIPAFVSRVVDTVGAGDAFFVLAAMAVAAGGTAAEAGFIGNVAGALKTQIVGHRDSLKKLEIQRFISTLLK